MNPHETDLLRKFNRIVDNHICNVDTSDYEKFELNKLMLLRIGEIENSSLTVFDMNKKHYLLLCSKFDDLIGYRLFNDQQINPDQMLHLMHPDDLPFVLDTINKTFTFFDKLATSEKKDYKLIVDFRLKNAMGFHVRFLQQMVVLELDKNGEIWLILKIVDLISGKAGEEPSQRRFLNMKTGKFYLFNDYVDDNSKNMLSKREAEILGLISQGLDSKQISERLFISVNTVNNHRQHILSKTKTENSIQALSYAKKIGII